MSTDTTQPKLLIDALALVPEKKSGIGKYIHNIVEGLQEIDYDYELVVPKGKAGLLQLQYPNSTIRELPFKARTIKLLDLVGLMPPIDRYCGKGAYFFGNFDNKPLSHGSKSLTCFHDIAFLRHPETIQRLNLLFLRLFYRRWVRRSDVLVTVSEFSRDEILSLIAPSQPVEIVPNSISATYRPTSDAAVIESYGLPAEPYLLFVGNIEPRKGLEAFLDWYAGHSESWQRQHKLVLVGGDGWRSQVVLDQIEKLNAGSGERVVFRPSRYVTEADLPTVYGGAKLAILPSLYEGYGVPVLEAVACGKPTLLSDARALQNIVTELKLQRLEMPGIDTTGTNYGVYGPGEASLSLVPSPAQSARTLLKLI
jgi:glycosyltransferase involved in cell wall biosynthesis